MTLRLTSVVVLTGLSLVSAVPAFARANHGSAFITAGDIADAPSGFIEMCERDRDLCLAGIQPATPQLELVVAKAQMAPTSFVLAASPTVAPRPSDAQCLLLLARLSLYLAPLHEGKALDSTKAAAMRSASTVGPVTAPDGLCSHTMFSAEPATVSSAALIRPALSWQSPPSAAKNLDLSTNAGARPSRGSVWSSGDISMLKKVNSRVNRGVRQISDYDAIGTDERWDRPGVSSRAVGDCEDFAIEKRMQLVEAGFAPDALFYGTVYKRGFGLHVVLIARTERGDMVLDSLTPHVMPWNKTKYRWLRVQSTEDPTVWRRVGAPSAPVMTADAGRADQGIS